MAYKKYDFFKLLREYNKEYNKRHKIDEKIAQATVVHNTGNDSFSVTYIYEMDGSADNSSLSDFAYYRLSNLNKAMFKNFIRQKEEKGLTIKIKIWPPSKIRYAYLYTNYFSDKSGPLGKSCMRCRDNQKALNFYVKNGVRIVVAIDGNSKIHARALLWDNVKSTRTKAIVTYLDRVYFRTEHIVPMFYKLAEKQGWKRYGSTNAGDAKYGWYIDDVIVEGICHLPYTDTFRYLYYMDKLLASGNVPSKVKYEDRYCNLTTTTAGGYFPALDPNRVREAITGNFISKKDATYIKRYDAWVLKKNIADVGGDYYSIHDAKVTSSPLDGWILKKNAVHEVFTNNMIDKTKAIESTKYKGYMHKANTVEIEGELYHRHDSEVVSFNDKWYHISQCFVVKGKLIPRSAAMIVYELGENKETGELTYKERYLICDKSIGMYIEVTVGFDVVHILNNSDSRQHLKKFNNKYYIKRAFKLPNKNQLLLFK